MNSVLELCFEYSNLYKYLSLSLMYYILKNTPVIKEMEGLTVPKLPMLVQDKRADPTPCGLTRINPEAKLADDVKCHCSTAVNGSSGNYNNLQVWSVCDW